MSRFLHGLRKRLCEHLRRFLLWRLLRLRRQLHRRLFRFLLWRLFQRLFRWLQIVLHSDLRQHWLRRLVPRPLLCRLHDFVPDVLRLLRHKLHSRIEVRR